MRGSTLFAALLAATSVDAMALSCMPGRSKYEIGDKVTYVHSDGSSRTYERLVVAGADPKTFQALTDSGTGPCAGLQVDYGVDAKRVFYHSSIVEGADPASFVLMPYGYARDKTAIYSRAKRLTTRLAEFRRMSEHSTWATDGEKYFHHDTIIDEPGFQFLKGGYGYARTATKVYHDGRLLRWADADTFEVSWPSVRTTRDGNFVYFADEVIPNADPRTFVQMRDYTFKDKRAVYIEGKELRGSDPASARVSQFGTYVIDDRTVYRYDKPVPDRDPATFQELQHPYTQDRNGVYHDGKPFAVDLASFKAPALQRAEDKHYRYSGTHRYCKFDPSDPMSLPICK